MIENLGPLMPAPSRAEVDPQIVREVSISKLEGFIREFEEHTARLGHNIKLNEGAIQLDEVRIQNWNDLIDQAHDRISQLEEWSDASP